MTDLDRLREDRVLARLARLTEELGSPLAAARYLYARDLLEDRK